MTRATSVSNHAHSALSIARGYIRRGWSPIPIPYRCKAPILDDWQNCRLSESDAAPHFDGSPKNIGVLLGEPSGGLIDIDMDCREAHVLADRLLAPTGSIFGRKSTPAAHRLYVAEGDCGRIRRLKSPEGDCLVEYRASGGQTVFPGSVHESGEPIEWFKDGAPREIDARELQQQVRELGAACLLLRRYPVQGSRHDFALALAGALLRGNWAVDRVRRLVKAVAGAAGDQELEDRIRAVASTKAAIERGDSATGWPRLARLIDGSGPKEKHAEAVRDMLGMPPLACVSVSTPRSQSPVTFPWTDYGNAQRLVEAHGDDLRYCHGMGRWFVWDGVRWRDDDSGEIVRRAKKTIRSLVKIALTMPEDKKDFADRLINFSRKSERIARLNAMIDLSRSEPEVVVRVNEMDADPWTINTLSGIVCLRTGELHPHDPSSLMTKLAPIEYEPEATCERFDLFLDTITDGRDDIVTYLQQLLGMCLTGIISEQILPILWGGGANGKSTLMDTMMSIMGDYAAIAAPDLLVSRHGAQHPTEIADLHGRRLVVCGETERNQHLRIQFVKQVTGDGVLKGRYMRQDFFEFRRTHKTIMHTNNRPIVGESTTAVWRRLRLIPFTVVIPPEDRDPHLLEKLQSEWPGIFAWMVRGCLSWQREGLLTPGDVLTATEEYRDESDHLERFLGERFEFITEGAPPWTPSARLWDTYTEWCRSTGEEAAPAREFWSRVRASGASDEKSRGMRGWSGVRILSRTSDEH